MRTLIIHTSDDTTTFGKLLHEDLLETIVVNFDIDTDGLKAILPLVDRVVMFGHGTKDGLLRGDGEGYIISKDNIDLLKDKELVGIWCYASSFAQENHLQGLFSGMFISEVEEAKRELPFMPPENLAFTISEACVNFVRELSCQLDTRKPLKDIADYWQKEAEICSGVKKYNYGRIVYL